MGREFDISLSRNRSINGTLSPTGRSFIEYATSFIWGQSEVWFLLVSLYYSVLPFFLSFHLLSFTSDIFFFSFDKRIGEHTYVFLHVVLALLLLTPGITSS